MNYLLVIFLISIIVEAIDEIFIESEFFASLRELSVKSKFFASLFGCGYCLSVWVAAPFGISILFFGIHLLDLNTIFSYILNGVINVFLIHRLSNIIHEGIKRWLDRIPFVMVLEHIKKEQIEQIEQIDKDVFEPTKEDIDE